MCNITLVFGRIAIILMTNNQISSLFDTTKLLFSHNPHTHFNLYFRSILPFPVAYLSDELILIVS